MKVISRLSLFVLIIVLIIIFCIDFMLDKERYHSIELDVSLERSESSILLHVRLTNKGIMPFPFYSGLLPWENDNIFQIVAIPFIQKDDQIVYQDIIKQHFFIADPVSSLKFIFPWKTIEGYIALSDRFSTQTMDLFKQKNVLICWNYPLPRYGEVNIHWYQGYVISQTREPEKLLISETRESMFNEKCSAVLVCIASVGWVNLRSRRMGEL